MKLPWLVWLSGLSAGLQTKGSLVPFPVRAHAQVEGQVPSNGCVRGNHTLMFLSLFLLPSLPLSLKINIFKKFSYIITYIAASSIRQPVYECCLPKCVPVLY